MTPTSSVNVARTYRFHVLLTCTILYLLLNPLLKEITALKIMTNVFMTFMLISGVFAVSQKKRHFLISGLLALGMMTPVWLEFFKHRLEFVLFGYTFGILFFSFTTWRIISFVFGARDISGDLICGSIVVYLLLAVVWSLAYGLLETVHPGSFAVAMGEPRDPGFIFLYYSFVTITTLGYGDVTPLTQTAGSLAFVEAVTGQLYIAVLVARLVGVHVAQSTSRRRPDKDDED